MTKIPSPQYPGKDFTRGCATSILLCDIFTHLCVTLCVFLAIGIVLFTTALVLPHVYHIHTDVCHFHTAMCCSVCLSTDCHSIIQQYFHDNVAKRQEDTRTLIWACVTTTQACAICVFLTIGTIVLLQYNKHQKNTRAPTHMRECPCGSWECHTGA